MGTFFLLFPLLAASLSHAADSYGSPSPSPSPSPAYGSPPQATHQVSVGDNGAFKYYPEYIDAEVGDKIVFTFHPKNHTVTQASFNDPCSPLQYGFNSGFRPVEAGTTYGLPTFTVDVKDKNPIWVYCGQPGPPRHCAQGMVFAANAPKSGNTFEEFKKKALALGASSASSTSVAPPQGTQAIHEVSVGANGTFKYDPECITAKPGEQIRFTFHQKAHSATQSGFDTPCSPLSYGFDSGLQTVAANVTSNFPTYTITVNDTKPIWMYCKQPGPPAHCPQGMVFAANAPTSGNTFEEFKKKALALGASSSSTYSAQQSSAYSAQQSSAYSAQQSSTYAAQPSSTYSGAYTSASDTCSAAKPVETYPFHPYVTHKVVVGGDAGFLFTPNSIDAVPGDFVLFEFQKTNHSVTQSSFNDPCTKLEISTLGYEKGFDSGFVSVDAGTTTYTTFQIQVNDTKPIWGYCRQTGHCVSGMAFGINAPKYGPHTIDAFLELAKHSNATSITPDYSSAKPGY